MDNKLNVDPNEIAKFDKMADSWWDPDGDFKPLHLLNPLRLDYIDRQSSGIFGKKVLDVGCGGGILAESMAKLGAKVDAIDMGLEPLKMAKLHAIESQVSINYLQSTAENHQLQHTNYYDVITCMEMLEHVPDPLSIIQACSNMLKPDGFVFFSTINRNVKAWLQAILGAEYLLKMLPAGTHEYHKFIRPSELIDYAEKAHLQCTDGLGITYNPITNIFSYTQSLNVNYMLTMIKEQ